MIRFFFIFLCSLFFGTLSGQEPHFIQHDIGDANAGIPIHKMLQDNQCMIWLGTDQGLARYDGMVLHPVRLDSSKIPAMVTSLMEDDDGNIWVGTASGQIFYLDAARMVHVFDPDEGHPEKSITAITQDHNGQIWFATYGEGVYVYTGSRLHNISVDDGLAGNEIYAMTFTPSGDIWIGTDDGINICTFQNEQKSVRKLGLKDGLPDQIITSLLADHLGNVWIGTFENGVVLFDAALNKILRPFNSPNFDEVTSFAIFDLTEVWIGTRNSGVWRYHWDTKQVRQLVELKKTRSGGVSDIMTDVEGNIWVSMEKGILLSAFRPFESLITDVGEIQTLFCDHNDQLWIGSKKGLYRVEEKTTEVSVTVRIATGYDLNITDILEDNFHNLWIGTLDKGLFIYNPANNNLIPVASEKLSGNTVMSMAQTKANIWIATLQGVMYYPTEKNIFNEKKVQFSLVSDPWQSNLHFVFHVFVDSKDRAWFATDGNGVYSIDGDKVTQYIGNDSFALGKVYSICEDNGGHLWFNTADNGLVEFDGTRYRPLNLDEGLGNLEIASIATVGTGDIIISHDRGIDLMEPERRHFMYYTDEVGANEIDPGTNSVATNSKGDVYVSGRDRILKYYATGRELSIHPRTQLTSVSAFDQQIDFKTDHTFAYDENYISFNYVGLWYTSPKSVKYRYKLEGYDLQWKESRDNVASYSSLPPGPYTFSVKASENKFFLDEPIASYSFVIAKPFWLTYWFLGSVLILIGAIFYFIVKAREKRSERQAFLQRDMIESQLQALKAQINPHFLFNSFNTLITIIDENTQKPEVAIEYVEKLSDFFRSILQYREQETISLAEELELVQNFGYLLQKRYSSNLRIHTPSPPKDACILPLTLQMLVENAVKHNVITEQRPLDVYITIEDDEFITVKNNRQPKSNSEPSTKFGLQSIVKRYLLLSDKKVNIESDQKSFIVRIPILKRSKE